MTIVTFEHLYFNSNDSDLDKLKDLPLETEIINIVVLKYQISKLTEIFEVLNTLPNLKEVNIKRAYVDRMRFLIPDQDCAQGYINEYLSQRLTN